MLSHLCRNRSGFLERFHRWAFHLPLHSCSHSARVCMTHHQSFQLPRPPCASPSICQDSPLPGHQPPPLRSNVSVMSSGLENCDNLSKQKPVSTADPLIVTKKYGSSLKEQPKAGATESEYLVGCCYKSPYMGAIACLLGVRRKFWWIILREESHSFCWNYKRAGLLCVCTLSCPIFCDSVDCSPPDPSVHGFPSKNTGVGCQSLLQGIIPTQESNSHLFYLLHWQAYSLPLSHLASWRFCFSVRHDDLGRYLTRSYNQPQTLSQTWEENSKGDTLD